MSLSLFRFIFFAGFVSIAPSAAFAQACSAIQGSWNGTFTRDGAGPQPISITISASCSAEWTLPNMCSLSNVQGTRATYQCSRGSVGTVTIAKNLLTWRNTVTGPQHGFYTIRVSR